MTQRPNKDALQQQTMTRSVWFGRALFTALAIFLVFPWAQAEFEVMRGGAEARVEAHLFFLGLASVCLLGLAYTFVPHRRGKIIAGLSLLFAFTGVWLSLLLMMIGVMPIWLWLVLSALWFASPVAVAVVFFGHMQGILLSRAAAGLTVALAMMALLVAWQPFVVATHKVPLDAIARWVTARSGSFRFRYDHMLWSLAGGPPHNLNEEHHRHALLTLGYFQQTNFSLRRTHVHDVLERARQVRFADSFWIIEPATNHRAFRLTAYGGDMDLWRAIVEDADRGQPTGPAPSGSQPIRSETNRAASAAGSRR